jgi:hypothetical protein
MWWEWLIACTFGVVMVVLLAMSIANLVDAYRGSSAKPTTALLPQVDRDTAARQEWELAFPDWWDYVPLPLVVEGRPEHPLARARAIAKTQARLNGLVLPRAGDPYNLVDDLRRIGEAVLTPVQVAEFAGYRSPAGHSLQYCTCEPCNRLRREKMARTKEL